MEDRKQLNGRVGARVRAAREQAGLTQERLAALIDVTPQYLSDLERGKVGFSVPTFKRMCEVLCLSADDVLMDRAAENDITPIVERLRRVPAEHLPIVEAIISRYLEGIALESGRQEGEP